MTVICWDGKTLAADKRAVTGGGISRSVTKIERCNNLLLAISGDWSIGSEMRAWFKAGHDAEKFPAEARKDDGRATLIVIFPNGAILSYASGPHAMVIEAKQCAWGSGRDYAEAVMHLGHTAVRAVEVACHFQSDCGNGIDKLEFLR